MAVIDPRTPAAGGPPSPPQGGPPVASGVMMQGAQAHPAQVGPLEGAQPPPAAGYPGRGVLPPPGGRSRHERAVAGILRRLLRHRAAVLGGTIVLRIVLMALLADVIAPYDPIRGRLSYMLQPPSRAHWMGTDEQADIQPHHPRQPDLAPGGAGGGGHLADDGYDHRRRVRLLRRLARPADHAGHRHPARLPFDPAGHRHHRDPGAEPDQRDGRRGHRGHAGLRPAGAGVGAFAEGAGLRPGRPGGRRRPRAHPLAAHPPNAPAPLIVQSTLSIGTAMLDAAAFPSWGSGPSRRRRSGGRCSRGRRSTSSWRRGSSPSRAGDHAGGAGLQPPRRRAAGTCWTRGSGGERKRTPPEPRRSVFGTAKMTKAVRRKGRGLVRQLRYLSR